MSKTVEYFMAPASPWAYLGHQRFVAIAKKHHANIELKPADIAKVFGATGGVPVAQRPIQRQEYRLAELTRWSAFLQIPLNLHPKFFPVSGELASKLIIATQQEVGAEAGLSVAFALGRAVWAEEKNIADSDTLASVADSLGLKGKDLMAHAASEAVATDYARHTDDALAAHIFGVPWYRVDGEGYWGQDRLDFVERALMA
ncbi:MAG: 2-hydroxychromene-2-carboxylate isomerase [Oxalobacteraceae bacterium]|nr:2-hydroxychromene-2-carboxylate isomerase [Oxalobacteraceae bacterium]